MTHEFISHLRAQPFYRGQILRLRDCPGRPPALAPADEIILSRFSRLQGGSLQSLLAAMGYDSVYSNLLSALGGAFGSTGDEDAILVADYSPPRELFWQLTALIEVLDEGRVCPILCRNEGAAERAERRLRALVERADLSYACSIFRLKRETAAAVLAQDFPLIQIFTPETLRMLLRGEFGMEFADRVLPAIRRVVIPNLSAWDVHRASHTAWLLRELHIEAARNGVALSMVATTSPASNIAEFVEAIWGKPVDAKAYIASDSVESPPATFAFYGGALVRDRDAGNACWIRQDLAKEAEELLRWLVNPVSGTGFVGSELHYVVDVSGSMAEALGMNDKSALSRLGDDLQRRLDQIDRTDREKNVPMQEMATRLKNKRLCRLDTVISAILRDFERRKEQNKLESVRSIKLTAFDTAATEEFVWSGDGDAGDVLPELQRAALGLAIRGGTNLPVGLGKAMESALETQASSLEFLLFSDGESPIPPSHRKHLLNLARQARGTGRRIDLVYVILDIYPPKQTENLIRELGGRVVSITTEDLVFRTDFNPEPEKEEVVVFYSAEGGLPDMVANSAKTGKRRLECIRHLSQLESDPKQVVAVVMSGRFTGFTDMACRVRHLGKSELVVFVLCEADTRTQILLQDYSPRGGELQPCLLVTPTNPLLTSTRLLDFGAGRGIEPQFARYLLQGAACFSEMRCSFQKAGEPSSDQTLDFILQTLPPDFRLDRSADYPLLKADNGEQELAMRAVDVFSTFSGDPNEHMLLRGSFAEKWDAWADASTAGLNLVPGRKIVLESGNFQVNQITEKTVDLTTPSLRSVQPILQEACVERLFPDTFEASGKTYRKFGALAHGRVRFCVKVVGVRFCERGNLDDPTNSPPEHFNTPVPVSFETVALRWRVEGEQTPPLAGIQSLLNICLPSVFRGFDETLLVVPEQNADGPCLWLVELAPGGNGAAGFLFTHPEVLQQVIRLGGLVALDCPCEGGFSGTTALAIDIPMLPATDPGCPRCTRAFGPTFNGDNADDQTVLPSKRATLEWLLEAGLLPGTARKHIEEKYIGTQDLERVSGPDFGTRRGALPLCRQILEDRLGLVLDDTHVAISGWLDNPRPEDLGSYDPGTNKLLIRKGLREWQLLDVTAHELYHNLQHRMEGLFEHSILGHDAEPQPPFEGKLFIEGSAVWAESHVVDGLAIRTALDYANLRQGDEYAAGFQLFKWIEERFGVGTVLKFLATGDIGEATNREITTLADLYRQAGVAERLRAFATNSQSES